MASSTKNTLQVAALLFVSASFLVWRPATCLMSLPLSLLMVFIEHPIESIQKLHLGLRVTMGMLFMLTIFLPRLQWMALGVIHALLFSYAMFPFKVQLLRVMKVPC